MFRWHADDGPTLNAGLVAEIFQGTCIARKPNIFVIFQGGGSGLPVPPLDPHMTPHYFMDSEITSSQIFLLDSVHLSFCLSISPTKAWNFFTQHAKIKEEFHCFKIKLWVLIGIASPEVMINWYIYNSTPISLLIQHSKTVLILQTSRLAQIWNWYNIGIFLFHSKTICYVDDKESSGWDFVYIHTTIVLK